jgi:hypothetical protein
MRLGFDELLQQARLAYSFRPEDQHGFARSGLVPQAAQLLFALDTAQIFKGRLALGGR